MQFASAAFYSKVLFTAFHCDDNMRRGNSGWLRARLPVALGTRRLSTMLGRENKEKCLILHREFSKFSVAKNWELKRVFDIGVIRYSRTCNERTYSLPTSN